MAQGSLYSDEQRREAAVQMALHGNPEHLSKLTGVPSRTLRDWVKQDWCQATVAELRSEKALELDSRFTEVLHSATAALMDRSR